VRQDDNHASLDAGNVTAFQRCPAKLFESFDRLSPPFRRRSPASRHFAVHLTITARIIGKAGRRVQVDGLKRAHERPTQAKSVAHNLIDIFGRGVAPFNKMHRFVQQRTLQSDSG